jgi:hypothetical protein
MFLTLPRNRTCSGASGRSSVRLRVESLEAREVPASLFIGGHQVHNNKTDYLAYIKYLTVPEDKQSDPAFGGTNMAAIKKLEDPLRRQIFTSMEYAPSRHFNFPDPEAAEKNFDMRVEIVHFMNMVNWPPNDPRNYLHLDFNYFGTNQQTGAYSDPTANPDYWYQLPAPAGSTLPSRAFHSRSDVTPYDAIMHIIDKPYRGECYGTIQIAILYAAADNMEPADFNALFPNGLAIGTLTNWQDLSVTQFLPQGQQFYEANGAKLGRANMVPGDWVYMKNNDQYEQLQPNGYWAGENAIYIGKTDHLNADGSPSYEHGVTAKFTGLGEEAKTEKQMREDVWTQFQNILPAGDPRKHEAPHGVRWTITVGPGMDDY